MANYYRINPEKINIAAPKGMYITNEEKNKTIIWVVLTSLFFCISQYFKFKFKRK